MKTISFKDYLFSFQRGNIFSNIKLILKNIFKQIIFKTIALSFLFQKTKKFEKLNIKKIAIYVPEKSGMGDLIMSTLFFKSVRELYSKAEIVIYTKSGIMIDRLNYNQIIDIGKLRIKDQFSSINQQKFDLLLIPEKSIKGSLLFLLSNSIFKLGYLSSYSLKANFKIEALSFVPHQNHYYLKSYLLSKAIHPSVELDKILYKPDLSFFDDKIDNTSSDYVVFIPCVLWSNRSISFEDSKKIVTEVLNSRYKVYLSGGEESIQTNRALLKEFSQFQEKIVFHEKLNLKDFVNVIKNSKGVICGDSGPMHIAYGFQKPVLSFWGPTLPDLRIPSKNTLNSVVIFEKNKCQVTNCYNMEHKPFCKTCLRLENIPDFSNRIKSFLLSI
jgi:heptosyltransferase-2